MALPTTIEKLDMDVLQNILTRLSAVDFAFADCVSHSWNQVCSRVLCRPKLASACSSNPSLDVAIEEVANKVLSNPIRPQFVIASVGRSFNMQEAFQLITAKLSSKVPVIVNWSCGIIGRDAISDEFEEIPKLENGYRGIMLTVGFVPGMKVKSISLQKQVEKYQLHVGMNAMEELDYAMSPETVIVGGFCYDFLRTATEELACEAVALVFVPDRNNPAGIGETRFHAVLSNGLSPEGPTYRVDSVTEKFGCMTYLTVHREGPFETEIDEMEELYSRYIGVTKRRKFSIGQEKAKWMSSLAFHEIMCIGADNASLTVEDMGIKIGDTFRCYDSNFNTARSSVDNVSNLLKSFKRRSSNDSDKWEVSGCFVFASEDRSKFFLGQPNDDSSVFVENFPGVTFAGTMCFGEIGRGYITPQESQEQKSAQGRFLHLNSAVYFIMSYAP